MQTFVVGSKLIALCVALNIIRYFVIGFVEQLLVFGPLFTAMEQSREYFNTDYQAVDWITSYLYNFAMWFCFLVAFHVHHPHMKGHMVWRSLRVFGLMLLIFLSISAIYMNHYSHPKDFYVWNMIDALIVLPLVALANGILYPFIFRRKDSRPEPIPE